MSELPEIIRLLLALAFVIALMGGLALVLKRLGLGIAEAKNTTGQKRLHLLESLPLDTRRRVVIIECDEKQHLVLLGVNDDTVIDINIKPQGYKNA